LIDRTTQFNFRFEKDVWGQISRQAFIIGVGVRLENFAKNSIELMWKATILQASIPQANASPQRSRLDHTRISIHLHVSGGFAAIPSVLSDVYIATATNDNRDRWSTRTVLVSTDEILEDFGMPI
jgi:hypothetical protein